MSSTNVPPTLPNEAAQEVYREVASILEDASAGALGKSQPLMQAAVVVAEHLQRRAGSLQTSAERRQQAELDRMIQAPSDKATLMQMTDQAFRARRAGRAADQLIHILDVQGVPRFFSAAEEAMLRGFQSFGGYLPGVAMPLVKERMRHETANVVLPAEERLLREHLLRRRNEGLRMNVNVLGEALLGEGHAQKRLQTYLHALARPEIEVVSVKISTIYSQIQPIAFNQTVETLADRLELLYRASIRETYLRADGVETPKMVYLDMEEYRDMASTVEAFINALDREGLREATAGIALQAYVPDSFAAQQRITDWARRRVAAGGAPVTLRLVKGANMEMERVESSLRGWELPTFSQKIDTDANYLRMLQYGLQRENLEAVRLGIASHNLFTLAYGVVLASHLRAVDRVQFEMLEGMANHQRRALFELARTVLLYGPACRQEDFTSAIGYLVRRLDENTGPDNFLRYAFSLQVGDEVWQRLRSDFLASFARIDELASASKRRQDRRLAEPPRTAPVGLREFANEPDTDWALRYHADWAAEILDTWRQRGGERAETAPLVVGGDVVDQDREIVASYDPSRPETLSAWRLEATSDDVQRAVSTAQIDPDQWRRKSASERCEFLARTADLLATRRADLLGVMTLDGGKLLTESDPEVSEAIDFCRFYGAAAQELSRGLGVELAGRGVVAVVSPWNFPLAIPCGGVAAALAAGNCVVLKPASETALAAWKLCQCFWDAGVPKTVLQFLTGAGQRVGKWLTSHAGVDTVVLTGGTATARAMLAEAPQMRLTAETGGKNATIVTALADRDLAIKNVLHSAFSHSGQKCSATSLLILEEEVYHDAGFRETLCDAVASLHVDSAWNPATRIGPLIRAPQGALERGLKDLEHGEEWAVMPRLHVSGNPCLVGPGVKWGVSNGSYTHRTEFFGPVLGVMCAHNLDEAINLVNETGYGLTSGLESLDDREHEQWQESVQAGNLYINRSTTGAIVYRQPFGGFGLSSVGPGVKAGG
ncbi:MAG: bifunctional proline dehydrogenase/L-glutamate gamma-semialdehyde dehydrogenase, partial [Planctomycetales bacterium]|nr:bifunctional proline dehydrogenase/L-glutamate gamma-semialdehyde dehydrogenase [Planctomycetales bacterium]